jgi:hypothetical protein
LWCNVLNGYSKPLAKLEEHFCEKGVKDVKGGHCLMGWQWVCRPANLVGLGILNLRDVELSIANKVVMTKENAARAAMEEHGHSDSFKCQRPDAARRDDV